MRLSGARGSTSAGYQSSQVPSFRWVESSTLIGSPAVSSGFEPDADVTRLFRASSEDEIKGLFPMPTEDEVERECAALVATS